LKFKQYLDDINFDKYITNESLKSLNEAEGTADKLNKLNKSADNIEKIDLVVLFQDIHTFIKTTPANMKISELKQWGLRIIKNLEKNIKIMLEIRKDLHTKYLNSLINQCSKLVGNIKDRITQNKEKYDLSLN